MFCFSSCCKLSNVYTNMGKPYACQLAPNPRPPREIISPDTARADVNVKTDPDVVQVTYYVCETPRTSDSRGKPSCAMLLPNTGARCRGPRRDTPIVKLNLARFPRDPIKRDRQGLGALTKSSARPLQKTTKKPIPLLKFGGVAQQPCKCASLARRRQRAFVSYSQLRIPSVA